MIAQVTTGFTAAGDLVIPGASCKVIALQNNGTANWRLAFGADSPTSSTGYLLAAGQQLILSLAQYPTIGPRCVRGFFVGGGGTQVLDIVTDDKDSTAPAHA